MARTIFQNTEKINYRFFKKKRKNYFKYKLQLHEISIFNFNKFAFAFILILFCNIPMSCNFRDDFLRYF